MENRVELFMFDIEDELSNYRKFCEHVGSCANGARTKITYTTCYTNDTMIVAVYGSPDFLASITAYSAVLDKNVDF